MSLHRLRRTDPVAVIALLVSAGTSSLWTWLMLSNDENIGRLRLLLVSVPGLLLARWSLQRTADAHRRRRGRPLAVAALVVGLLPAVAVSYLFVAIVVIALSGYPMRAD